MSRKNNKKGLALFIIGILVIVMSVLTTISLADDYGYKSKYITNEKGETIEIKNYFKYFIAQEIDWGLVVDRPTIGKLAYDVLNNKNAFMTISNPSSFVGTNYSYEAYDGTNVIEFPNSICLYHNTSSTGEASYIISNVIDINMDEKGTIKIYGTNGTTITDNGWGNAIAYAMSKSIESNAYGHYTIGHQAVSYAWQNGFYTLIKGNIDTRLYTNNTLGTNYTGNDSGNLPASSKNSKDVTIASIINNVKNNSNVSGIDIKVEKVTTTNIIYDDSGNSYIGPLKITYGEEKTTPTLSSVEVTSGNNTYTAKLALKKGEGFEDKTTLQITSGNEYYVKVNKKLTSATITMKTQQDEVAYYKARILVGISPVGNANNQNTLIYNVEEVKASPQSSVTVERKTAKVVLQKQKTTEKGTSNLEQEGITFAIYKGNLTAEDISSKTPIKTVTTKRKTDSEPGGKTEAIELEPGDYTVVEVGWSNQVAAYGYKGLISYDGDGDNFDNITRFTVSENDISLECVTINIKNIRQYGQMIIKKVSEYNKENVIAGAEFKIKNDSGYIKLTDTKGNFVQNLTGEVLITKTGKAEILDNNTYYLVQYVDKKEEATTFITNSEGNIIIHHLEVYQAYNSKYKYTVEEVSTGANNSYFDLVKIDDIELINGDYLEEEEVTYVKSNDNSDNLEDPFKYTDLSGYVWLDKITGKGHNENESKYDNKYIEPTTDNGSADEKLSRIKVKLVDENGKEVYDENKNVYETETDANGNYIFKKVEIAKLVDYSIVFEYNGLTYTTIPTDLKSDNTSKGAEVYDDRATVNAQYTNITGETVPNANNTVTATTKTAKFDLSEWYSTQKEAKKLLNEGKEVTNINLGLRTREQPDLAISNDVQNLILTLNGYQYTYNFEEVENAAAAQGVDFNVSAKFRYSLNIYASDIQACIENSTNTLEAYVTYKITVSNQNTTLGTTVKQIKDYYDGGFKYDDIEIGNQIDSNGNLSLNNLSVSTDIGSTSDLGANKKVTELLINLNGENGVQINAQEKYTIYVKFKLLDETVLGLLNEDTGIYNVATISSYQSFYGKDTYEGSNPGDGKTNEGKIYAGLDEDSIPNNEKISFQTDENGNVILYDKNGNNPPAEGKNGTPEIYTTDFEDDTSSAPTLVLQSDNYRSISGTVFEDTNAGTKENERLGNGKMENEENRVEGVIVELLKVDDSGNVSPATYFNKNVEDGGEKISVTTKESGEYTFGKYENDKYFGVLPGEYVIRFTYVDGTSKIMTADGTEVGVVSVLEHKSTIISKEIRNMWNSDSRKWYLEDNVLENIAYSVKNGTYSVAVDDYGIVENLNNYEINYNTINNVAETKMEAYTPAISIGIEFETLNSVSAMKYENGQLISAEFVPSFDNLNFGIIEKPHASVETTKTITNIEYTNAKGETLFVGNPTENDKIQYVKYANTDTNNRFVEGEIDTDLIQGSTLKVTYAMNIKNTSEIDYATKEYYYFGTNEQKAEQAKLNITKVVDYMSSDIAFNEEKTKSLNEDTENVWVATERNTDFEELIDTTTVDTTGYQILISEKYNDIANGETRTTYSYASVVTQTSVDDIDFINSIEILEYTGGKRIVNTIVGDQITYTTPGNYNPKEYDKLETDSAMIRATINPTTGKDINYTPYIITGIITLIIVAAGIVIIKKRLLK